MWCITCEPLVHDSQVGLVRRNSTVGPNVVMTSRLMTLRVLEQRESWRDISSRLWSFKEVEFLLNAEVTHVVVSYNSALSPFPSPEMQHNKNRSMLILVKKIEAMRVIKGVC